MDMAYEELVMREKENTDMCMTCEKGITFEPGDLVIRKFFAGDSRTVLTYYEGLQTGEVLETDPDLGSVLVMWGIDKHGLPFGEWCWPSDFVARIRNGKYETINECGGYPFVGFRAFRSRDN